MMTAQTNLRKLWPAMLLAFVFVTTAFAVQDVDKIVADEMARQKIPGVAVAVIHNGKVVKEKGYGVANVELKIPVTTESVFKIGSISKPMIALAVMKLVEEGKIGLDDPVSKFISDAPATWKEITIRHLLSHTSGIIREAPGFDPFKVQKDYEVIKTAFGEPLVFQPSEKYQYCNVGYFSLAEIIARVSGKPWPEYVNEVVFAPNKMSSTRATSNVDLVANRANGYAFIQDKLVNAESYRALRPSGAFLSSLKDMVAFGLALDNVPPVKRETLTLMQTAVKLKDGTSAPYGLGFQVGKMRGKSRTGHGGSLSGFRTDMAIFPDDKLTIIVLANLDSANPSAISAAIAEAYIDFPAPTAKPANE